MTRKIFWLTLVLGIGLALSLNAAPTPTPTSTPKKPFFPPFKVSRSATPARTGSVANRGAHLGVDRSAQNPAPKPTPTPKPKSKSSPSGARKSPTPTPSKSAQSATPSSTLSPQKEISPAAPPSPTPSAASESVAPSPTPSPTATTTVTVITTAKPTASISPASRSTKIELTLTKFEPAHGSPGERDYRSARLSYRINVPNRMEFPTINFSVETSSGKLFERVFTLPAGSAFVEPGDNTEHTVALDAVARDDWADAYAKTDKATFNWSIEGQASGHSEMPVKKPWGVITPPVRF